MSGSKHKSSGDVAGTGKKCQAIKTVFVGLMNKLDLGMCSRNGTRSYIGDLLYFHLILNEWI